MIPIVSKEIKIRITGVLGAATVFSQGGSLRLILPKRARLLLESTDFDKDDDSEKKTITVIVLNSDKGLLLTSLKKYHDGH